MTEAALLEAIRAAHRANDSGEGVRVEEVVDASRAAGTPIAEDTVRRFLRSGLKAGTVKRTKREIEGIDGRRVVVSGYLIAKK